MKKDIRFLLTQGCNYNCYFCHNEGIDKCLSRQELTIDEYVSLYDMYSKIESWNGVTISGGEPLICKDLLKLVKALHLKGAIITLVTNGYMLLENMAVLKYIDRINVSLHTMRVDIYEKIVRRTDVFHKVIHGLEVAREIYPSLKIKINVTPTKEMDWSKELLCELIDFSKNIKSSLKLTELFPSNDINCIIIEDLRKLLIELGYIEIQSNDRNHDFINENHHIYLTQCTCSAANQFSKPVDFCRESHDLYVNHTGHFILCRLENENIEFLEDLREHNHTIMEMKMKLAQRRISNQLCKNYLKIQ